ncbi:MAG: DUF3592 domain-containing protein [Phycisphaeraceae bacterium]
MAKSGNMSPSQARKVTTLFHWIGLIGLVVGGVIAARTLLFIQSAQQATAAVVSVRTSTSGTGSDRSTVYYPTLRYEDQAGRSHTNETTFGSSSFNYRQGTELAIYLDPEDPASFRINSFMGLWFLPLVLSGVGVGFMTIAGLTRRGLTVAEKAGSFDHAEDEPEAVSTGAAAGAAGQADEPERLA